VIFPSSGPYHLQPFSVDELSKAVARYHVVLPLYTKISSELMLFVMRLTIPHPRIIQPSRLGAGQDLGSRPPHLSPHVITGDAIQLPHPAIQTVDLAITCRYKIDNFDCTNHRSSKFQGSDINLKES
jgi:hypothetical protein